MTPSFLKLCRRAAAALLAAGLVGSPAQAALDTTALTDDHSINAPTAWWTYANQTPQQVSDRLNEHNARLVGLEVQAVTNAGEPRLTVRMVANSGAYAVPGWWWYYDQSPQQITALLNANSGRLIELERYDRGGGQIRYAAVMVANTGPAARSWSYLMGVTRAQVDSHISATASRPIDLDAYGEGRARRFNAVFVSNTGADLRAFNWDVDQTPAEIATRTSSFNGRLVKLGRHSDGRYLYIQVRNTGSNSSHWWHKVGFTSTTELHNYAVQMGARPVDVLSYATANGRRFDAALIDNANDEERRMREHYAPLIDGNQNPMGIFQAYLKEVDGPVLINLNGQRRAETASSLKVLHLLHAMKQVQAGTDFLLAGNFVFYTSTYSNNPENPKDRCPLVLQENTGSWNLNQSTLEWGLDKMIKVSDNRTTRGVVLRYGGSFAPFNATAAAAGLTSTTLRHNIGCAYYDEYTAEHRPSSLRNDTSAADLAKIFEGVWSGRLLGSANRARLEFLESTFSAIGATGQVQAIIEEEAALQGKSAIAAQFGALVKTWGKGGSYDGACLGDPADRTQCGQAVMVRSGAGLMRLPIGGSGPYLGYRYYVHGKLISDVPYNNPNQLDTYNAAHKKASGELFRGVIRAALQSW